MSANTQAARHDAIRALHARFGTAGTSAVDLVNKLQDHGLISDCVVEPKEAATCDLVEAARSQLTPG